MLIRMVCIAILVCASAFCGKAVAQSAEVRVAAAADLKFAMVELASRYEKQTGTKINVTYGSSGNFFSQVQNGAPFDLFFSADTDYPRKLIDTGLADAETFYEYAVGRIVVWIPPDSKIDAAELKWRALLEPTVQKIAIANPAHAPYGRAAISALQKAGIYEQVKRKLVYGENVSQAAQFVESGNAQAGILPLSLAVSPAMKNGRRWEVPAEMHSPIRQAAIMLKNAKNKPAARAFLDLVKSEAGRDILANYGFSSPAMGNSQIKRK